ncbi:MAG TPA: phospholipase D-like domain-containing protein [Planctomycetota bacterium]|nr:phospholipase D-like domain-containing protein [Planctomycetota bacterium]
MTSLAQSAPAGLRAVPGRNCWRVERAERFHCIRDGEEYFRLVRQAILAAQSSIFILGWDIAAGVDLAPGAEPSDEPTELAALLDYVVRRRRGLHCHVLIWDYAAFYAIERDPLSRLRLGLGTHRRVVFRFDDRHAFGASHHQKVVVVDDRLAFSGSIDLTHHRWDTSAHRLAEPRRRNALGGPYGPYHEVAAMLEGPAAAALGELARARWRRRHWRRPLPAVAPRATSPWPDGVEAELLDVDVAIARTEHALARRPAVRECEALFLDHIAGARTTLYIENQYFTNPRLGAALAERLREPDGPEIVVVVPHECEGWLERQTMGKLRSGVLADLQAADAHGRLSVLVPYASRASETCTFIHSKVMVVDDDVLRIGSANLSNRSMGFDTECDVAVLSQGDDGVRAGIRQVRAALVAEHLGVEPDDVEAAVAREGSLRAAIAALSGGDRTLAPYELPADADEEPAAVVRDTVDPDEPLPMSQAVDQLGPELAESEPRSRLLSWTLPAATLAVALLVGWRALEAGHWTTLSELRELLAMVPPSAREFLAGLGIFVACGLSFVPLEVLVFAAVLLFGPGHGSALALLGTALCAALGYDAGRALGRDRLLAWLGARGQRLWPHADGHGTLTVAVLHLVSVASANWIHLLSGAARVPLRDFAAGTLLGIAPVLLALGALAVLVRRLLLHPGLGIALVTAGLAFALALAVRRVRSSLIRRHSDPMLRAGRERDAYG